MAMRRPTTGRPAVKVAIAIALVAVFSSGGPGSWPPTARLSRFVQGQREIPAGPGLPADFTHVDIGLLEGDDFDLGKTFGDDVLPIIRRPEHGARSTVVTFDASSGRLTHLPALPGDGWMGDAAVGATADAVVLVGRVCTSLTTEGDAGTECPTSDRPEIFVFDRPGERWFHRTPPPSAGPQPPLFTGGFPSIDRIEGTRVQFLYQPDGSDPPQTERLLALSLEPGLPEIPAVASAVGPPRCEYGDPGLTLSSTFEAEHADVIDQETGTSTRFAVPAPIRTRLRPGFPNDVLCYSAATHLMVRPDPAHRSCVPNAFVAGTEPGTTTTAPCPPDSTALWIVDLRRPDDAPVRAGDDVTFTGQFGGSSTYWGFADDAGLHLHRTADGTDRVVAMGPFQSPALLRSAVVVVTRARTGGLDALSVLSMR